ncbi:hypothetical protein BaRGS_00001429, partial [Batillaria attramentaria]
MRTWTGSRQAAADIGQLESRMEQNGRTPLVQAENFFSEGNGKLRVRASITVMMNFRRVSEN